MNGLAVRHLKSTRLIELAPCAYPRGAAGRRGSDGGCTACAAPIDNSADEKRARVVWLCTAALQVWSVRSSAGVLGGHNQMRPPPTTSFIRRKMNVSSEADIGTTVNEKGSRCCVPITMSNDIGANVSR